jgi:uncharacterized membrane protein
VKRLRPSAALLIAAGASLLAMLAYPIAAEAAIARFGVRGVAGALLVLDAVPLLARVALDPGGRLRIALQHGGTLLLAALALASGDRLWLLLFPALVSATLCAIFLASRRQDPCIVESLVRWLQPHSPDFVRPYCRALALLWGGIFGLAALAIASAALFAPGAWRTTALSGYAGAVVAVSAAEFVFRKLWFRHYTNRPLDQWFARHFPAERTERGRRSMAYIQRMKALGYDRN